MSTARLLMLCGLLTVLTAGPVRAQQGSPPPDDRLTPERLGLPKGSTRTSEPFITRIYKTDDGGEILKPQPKDYPFSIHEAYKLKENEKPRPHEGIDLSSRAAPGQPPKPLDFTAGVYGIVVKAGDGAWGTISVQLAEGSVLQYLHTSASHVKVGDVVAPDTRLGRTGKTGAGIIHLHIQARDKHKNVISPDLAFRLGQKTLATPLKPEDDARADFDPEHFPEFEPEVVNGVVHPYKPKTKWILEVIGGGGRVDLVLGEFPTYWDALHCSMAWSVSRPDDLRLTREREIPLGSEKK